MPFLRYPPLPSPNKNHTPLFFRQMAFAAAPRNPLQFSQNGSDNFHQSSLTFLPYSYFHTNTDNYSMDDNIFYEMPDNPHRSNPVLMPGLRRTPRHMPYPGITTAGCYGLTTASPMKIRPSSH